MCKLPNATGSTARTMTPAVSSLQSKLYIAMRDVVVQMALFKLKKRLSRKQKRWWIRGWLLRRHLGATQLISELAYEDPESYKNYFRMDETQFNYLLNKVSKRITKHDTKWREALAPKLKLQITLRYLASGNSLKTLSYQFRVSASSISIFLPSVLEAVYEELKNYVQIADTEETWQSIIDGFDEKCNFPSCGGAIDGKHVQIRCPPNSGSDYYNYKGTFSMVLLAVCDSNLKFTYINVGHYGRASDGGIFSRSNFKRMLEERSLNAPERMVLLGDEAFPLTEYLMKPYCRRLNLSREQKIFNYRLCRARRTIENSFGVLVSKFRVFERPIPLLPETVHKIIKACCVLHNWLKTTSTNYIGPGLIDEENSEKGDFVGGTWRSLRMDAFTPLLNPDRNHSRNAISVREAYTEYFSGQGRVEWQDRMIY